MSQIKRIIEAYVVNCFKSKDGKTQFYEFVKFNHQRGICSTLLVLKTTLSSLMKI